MLHPFISSPTASRSHAPVLVLSASVHVVLFYVALTSTGGLRRTQVSETAAEQVRFATLPFRAAPNPARRAHSRARRVRRASTSVAFTLPPPLLLVSFDLVLPEPAPLPDYRPDVAAIEIGGHAGLADDVLHLGVRPATTRRPASAPYDAYDEVAVEKPAAPVSVNRKPHYPSRMLSLGIETRFNVTFVVDTSGRVDRETIELPRSVQREFTSAVADALYEWRFAPAELGGRHVRQRVLQPFIFQVAGQFSSAGRP